MPIKLKKPIEEKGASPFSLSTDNQNESNRLRSAFLAMQQKIKHLSAKLNEAKREVRQTQLTLRNKEREMLQLQRDNFELENKVRALLQRLNDNQFGGR